MAHTHNHDHSHDHVITASELKQNVPKIVLPTLAQTVVAFLIFWLVAPKVLGAELASGWNLVLWVFLMGLPLSLFEYLYHRYLLHSAILPFLKNMHEAHRDHHGLTTVKAAISKKLPLKKAPVASTYPIEQEHQEESMMFPWFSMTIFYGVFLALLAVPAFFIFPGAPVWTATLIAATLFYLSYEVWHQILHLPYEPNWKDAMEGKMGKMISRVYSFHLMHHWRPQSNLAVVGFWGFAIWDYVFRTHHRPKNVPVQGAMVDFADADMKRPIWPINMVDGWEAGMYKWSRKIESIVARIFGKRQAG
ncbi:hypothetical protein QPK87_14140 [Kamptonema cortianum]|nr:hypothetical protein [Geitlerinema splendidum]MDK3157708.1 hypothetical protein [Kamptonema cortianum]